MQLLFLRTKLIHLLAIYGWIMFLSVYKSYVHIILYTIYHSLVNVP